MTKLEEATTAYTGATTGGNVSKSDLIGLFEFPLAKIGYVECLGVDDTGATDVSADVQALMDTVDVLVFPAGTFYVQLTNTSGKAIWGAGQSLTVLTSEALTTGTTITVGADLEIHNITVKGHPTNAGSKTIEHTGPYYVIGRNVSFTGTNHSPAAGVDAAGDWRACSWDTTSSAGGGANCWSALGKFRNCEFTGIETINARDSIFWYCDVGTADTQNAVHIPDGSTSNDGSANGFTGKCEFHYCTLTSGGAGVTQGNAGHVILRHCTLRTGLFGLGSAAVYSRTISTVDIEYCDIDAGGGTGVSFAKTDQQDPNNIGVSGDSIIKRSRIKGGFSDMAVPSLADLTPTIGEVLLVDVDFASGDKEISPSSSTYYRFATEVSQSYDARVNFANDGETLGFEFKRNGQFVAVQGVNGAKTGCFLSHIDPRTGQPHNEGMTATLIYAGVSSRFVTLSNGLSADGGRIRFDGNPSTFQIGQFTTKTIRLDGVNWKEI